MKSKSIMRKNELNDSIKTIFYFTFADTWDVKTVLKKEFDFGTSYEKAAEIIIEELELNNIFISNKVSLENYHILLHNGQDDKPYKFSVMTRNIREYKATKNEFYFERLKNKEDNFDGHI